MEGEPNLSLRRSKRTGTWICLGALVGAGLFLVGVLQGSYWALAVPVTVGVLTTLLLAFWIGYTINTVNNIPQQAEQYVGAAPRRIALLICACAIGLAVAFVAGVLEQSYLALAVPVAVAVLGLLAMIFWIGWAIVTQRGTLPSAGAEPQAKPETEAPAESQDQAAS